MITAAEFIKQTTTVPAKFVDELFEFYNENTLPTDFVIELSIVAKWLQASKKVLTTTLRSSYKLNIDYTKTKYKDPKKAKSNHCVRYMLTPECFKMVCMASAAKNGRAVRQYFIEVEANFIKYRHQLLEGMKLDNERLLRNQRPSNVEPKQGYIYVFKASDQLNLYRIGRSSDLKRLIREHQSSRADNIDIMYQFKTDDIVFVESCIHKALKDKQYRKYKEVFEADVDLIKMLLNKCSGVIDARKVFESRKPPTQNGRYFLMFDGAIASADETSTA
jgi:phage anti-repressor protein